MKVFLSWRVFLRPLIVSFWLILLGPEAKSQLMYCPDIEDFQSAWSMNLTQIERFGSDMTLPRNASVKKREAVKRVNKRIEQKNHGNTRLASNQELAELVVWAAECTGNDFTVLSALLEKESRLCNDRYNEPSPKFKGGDSGCGQFTTAGIRVLQNQLNLSNGNSLSKNQDMIDSMEKMISECFDSRPDFATSSYPMTLEGFKQLFNLKSSKLRRLLRSYDTPVLPHDLLAPAIKLKFHAARKNSYPKGLKVYHSGPFIETYPDDVMSMAEATDLRCFEDRNTPEVLRLACEMTDDPNRCIEEEYFRLGLDSTIEI